MPAVTFTTRGALGKSSLREANERLILYTILRRPGISRLELARHSGLSPSAMTIIIDRLQTGGWVREEEPLKQARVGRRPSGLRVRPESRLALGVEISPFEATATLCDLHGEVVQERSLAATRNAESFLTKIHGVIRGLVNAAGPNMLGVGISIPGNIDQATGTVIAATNMHWRNLDALRLLRQDLGVPFYCENNSNLAALAERWFNLEALNDFVFVTLRAGLGTGIISAGALIRGSANRAGEFGHSVIHPEGRHCLCGNRGCWEEYASDRALVRMYEERGGTQGLTSLQIVERARQDDAVASGALQDAAGELALGFVNLAMALNPAAIVVDDFAAAGWDLIENRVWQGLRDRVPEYWLEGLRIFPSRHATHSSLRGAVALVLSKYFADFGRGSEMRMAAV